MTVPTFAFFLAFLVRKHHGRHQKLFDFEGLDERRLLETSNLCSKSQFSAKACVIRLHSLAMLFMAAEPMVAFGPSSLQATSLETILTPSRVALKPAGQRSPYPRASADSHADVSETFLKSVQGEMRPGSYLVRESTAVARIEEACKALEAQSTRPVFPQDLMVVNGTWRLIYSSSLALPASQVQFSPLLDQLEASPLAPRGVEQRLDVVKRRVINKVSLAPWPISSPLSSLPGIGGVLEKLEPSVITLELDHAFKTAGEQDSTRDRQSVVGGSVIELQLEKIRRVLQDESDMTGWSNAEQSGDAQNIQEQGIPRETSGNLLFDLIPKQSSYDLPRPFSTFAAGKFETTYVDARVRISRGLVDFGPLSELRVFERVGISGFLEQETKSEENRP